MVLAESIGRTILYVNGKIYLIAIQTLMRGCRVSEVVNA